MASIHIDDLAAAIDHLRARAPAGDGLTLPAALGALVEVYARLAWARRDAVEETQLGALAHGAWLQWYASMPDTPCIAICSTSQGDAVCKGCGRTEVEVQHWPALSPAAKRAVWRRIEAEGTAWRFTRYAERAARGPTAT